MNKYILSILICISCINGRAEDYIESINVISEEYVDSVKNIPIVRNINGGTVIIPVFDETCPEEMKAPFSFACKIVNQADGTTNSFNFKR